MLPYGERIRRLTTVCVPASSDFLVRIVAPLIPLLTERHSRRHKSSRKLYRRSVKAKMRAKAKMSRKTRRKQHA